MNSQLIVHLTQALAGSQESVRPLADLELPEREAEMLVGEKLADLRPAAVLIPVTERAGTPHIVLTQRSDQLRRHAGQISFPGGSADPGDQGPVDTALREAHEEIGLARDQVKVIGFLDDYPTITGFRITPVVALLGQAAELQADGEEVIEVFEVPLAFLMDLQNYQQHFFERDGLRLPYHAVPYGERYIWGATAAILKDLQKRYSRALNPTD